MWKPANLPRFGIDHNATTTRHTMKPIRFFSKLSILALCAATSVHAIAQSAPGGLGVGRGATGTAAIETATPAPAPAISCEIPDMSLEDAVANILDIAASK